MADKLTRVKAIRLRCLNCSGNEHKQILDCDREDCELFPFRMNKRPKGCQPFKAIYKYCLWCSGDSEVNRKECPVEDCSLWQFRNRAAAKLRNAQKIEKTHSVG